MKNDLDTAGIIYLYPTSFLPEVNEMSKQIPIVNIGDKNDEITFDSIHISSVKPARLVAEHLISLGHRKITYISTPITDIERSRSKRYDALVATFKEHGFGAVSYTHLDVYKRQSMYCIHGQFNIFSCFSCNFLLYWKNCF